MDKKPAPEGGSLRCSSDGGFVSLGDGDEVDTARVGLRTDDNLELLALLMGVEHVDVSPAHHDIPIEVDPSLEREGVTHLAALTGGRSRLGAQFGALSFQECLHERGVHEARGAVLVYLGVPGEANQLVFGDGFTAGLDKVEQLLAFQRGAGEGDGVLGVLGGFHGALLGGTHRGNLCDNLRGFLGGMGEESLDFRGVGHGGIGVAGLGLGRSHGIGVDCLHKDSTVPSVWRGMGTELLKQTSKHP